MIPFFRQLSSGIDITYEHCGFCGHKVTKVAGYKVVVYDYLSHVRHICRIGAMIYDLNSIE